MNLHHQQTIRLTDHPVAATERPLGPPPEPYPGTALNPATARMKIPAPEITIHQTVPKTTHSSKIQHRRRGTPALLRERPKKR